MTTDGQSLDRLCIDTLRFLAVDAVQKANSGHPGLPLDAAPMAYVLWTRFLRHHPRNPAWFDRDRFVLSAGHGSMLLYGLLHLTGYDVSLDDIKSFRQAGSKTPGHPERGHTPGVEVTTGPLGQGMANAVGMAIAEAHLAARHDRPGFAVVDHYTYALVSDGDLMEGVASEAASLAGHLRLGKLICLYDDNRVTLAGGTDITFSEDRAARFRAYGWHTAAVPDGNDVAAIDAAIREARAETARPSLVCVRTHLGYGSPHKQDTFEAHGSPLGADEVRLTKEALGWPVEPAFLIPEAAARRYREAVERGAREEAAWNDLMKRYAGAFPDLARELRAIVAGDLAPGWEASIPVFPPDPKGLATRVASGKVMNAVAARVPALAGGSADLDPSTYTALTGLGDFSLAASAPSDPQGSVGGGWGPAGRNVHFGVREHAMAAICNGLAAHGGVRPYDSTFLVFSDYMRPSIRLGALMKLPVIHVFTHDSIALGEDGPTHQPVEHLSALRAIPGLVVIRPADANETAAAWRYALARRDGPVALVLTRQAVPTLDRTRYAPAEGLVRGAYVLADKGGAPKLILIATGSEVRLIVEAAERLHSQGIAVRCVSMPSWELFDALTQAERDAVLPPSVRARLAVEAGIARGWRDYVGEAGDVVSLERFGESAPGDEAMKDLGFTVDEVCRRALALL